MSGSNKDVQGLPAKRTSMPPLNLAKIELVKTFLAKIKDDYDWKANILAKTAKLENRTGQSYIKLVLELYAKLHSNKERIGKYKEEVKNLSTLTTESLESLARALKVQKAKERQIAKLVYWRAEMAV
ncbi:hypothetical protein R1flu_023072 [Riccia fluitans]|uniref:Uncharacterized protein n=1 Tax=Riccia fluitans TaxID=41844 RepID=A0ABD1XRH0_9MARC